ncbi:MAG: TSCPD domain-containing protein, partial [Lachnospiraceae bacterium]|nr:TSCPD domain-containing protein [Lachnospiraceae bacterium]
MIYKTKGTCSQQIDIEIKDGVIESVKFFGGCNGNLQGIAA